MAGHKIIKATEGNTMSTIWTRAASSTYMGVLSRVESVTTGSAGTQVFIKNFSTLWISSGGEHTLLLLVRTTGVKIKDVKSFFRFKYFS